MTVPSDGMFGPLNEDELREAERAAPTSKDADPLPIVPAPAVVPRISSIEGQGFWSH